MSEKLSRTEQSPGYKLNLQRVLDVLIYKPHRFILENILKGHLSKWLVYGVYGLGIAYLIFLASSIHPDIFYSGDAGLKYIIVKQIHSGEGFKYLALHQSPWVQQIWKSGFFPLNKPFIYPSPQGYIFSFPPAFEVISAFFYGKLGYAGLYVIPIASTILLWIWVGVLLYKSGTKLYKIALAIFILVFCSPLTIYGATFWEHMPTVLLLFSGIAFIVDPPENAWIGAAMGAICGLAVWLRPEALSMNIFYALTIVFSNHKQKRSSKRGFLIMLLTITIVFFAFNKQVYGSFFGVHGYQIFQDHSFGYKILRGFRYGWVLNWMLIQIFPFSLLILFILYRWLVYRKPPDQVIQNLVLAAMAFSILTPAFFPNAGGGQWGPRYFLPLIPPVLVILGLTDEKAITKGIKRRTLGYNCLILALMVYSFYLNVFIGGQIKLRERYSDRITPALDFVKEQKEEVIVVNSDFIPMEMGAVFNEKNFFLAENIRDLNRLVPLLKQHGQDRFLYISDRGELPVLSNLLSISKAGNVKRGIYFVTVYAIR